MTGQHIPASHLDITLGEELTALADARWRKVDAAAAATKPASSKSPKSVAAPDLVDKKPAPKLPTSGPAPKPVPKNVPKTPAPRRSPSGSARPITLQPGSVILSPEEGAALDHLLDHPVVKGLIEREDL